MRCRANKKVSANANADSNADANRIGRNTFLSSPRLCFIVVFICDLFVSRDDPMMS